MALYINKLQKPFADYLGILSSLLCLVHCLLTPAILSMNFIYLTNSSQFEVIEYTFLFLSLMAVFFSSKKYKGYLGKVIIWLTFLIFAASIIFHDIIPVAVSYIASTGLIFLHFLNLVLKNRLKAVKF